MNDSPETEALRKDMEELRKDFAALTKDVKSGSREGLQAGMDKARECASGLGGEIGSRPFTSIMAAFGIGLLLGKLFSR